jgi:hypothetical protein
MSRTTYGCLVHYVGQIYDVLAQFPDSLVILSLSDHNVIFHVAKCIYKMFKKGKLVFMP